MGDIVSDRRIDSTDRLAATLDMLARLVAFDTESVKSNLPLVAEVESYLRAHGVDYVKVPNAAGDKAALFATIGPKIDGGVVLSGHTDSFPSPDRAGPRTPSPSAARVAASMRAAPAT